MTVYPSLQAVADAAGVDLQLAYAEAGLSDSTYYRHRSGAMGVSRAAEVRVLEAIAALADDERERLTESAAWLALREQLRQRRLELNMTQPDVDARLGCADALVAKYETGARLPAGWFTLACWAEALNARIVLVPCGGAANAS